MLKKPLELFIIYLAQASLGLKHCMGNEMH